MDQQPIDQRNVKVELVVQRLDNNVLCGDSLRDSHMKEALSHNMIHQIKKKQFENVDIKMHQQLRQYLVLHKYV